MAYNNTNHLKHVARVMEVYMSVKEQDVPDTRIVKKIFPDHHINISYRTLMNYKGMKQSEYKPVNQLSLFDAPLLVAA